MASKHDPGEWFRVHDASPLAEIPSTTPYQQERSYDGGHTWGELRPSRAEFAHLASTEAAMDGRRSDVTAAAVVIEERGGHLTRWTRTA